MGALVNLTGRYFFKNMIGHQGKRREYSCRLAEITPLSMSLIAPVAGRVGTQVGVEFEELGKLDGKVNGTIWQGFTVQIAANEEDREKLAAKISWLEKYTRDEVPDQRQHKRIIPKNPISTVFLLDGSKHNSFVIDVSASGVALSAEIVPELGTPLAVGKVVGRVVRHLPTGFAVHFAELQDLAKIERAIAYTPRD
jgi:hypothetical protein